MGWPFQWMLQGLVVLHAGYTLAQERVLLAVGCWWLGQWTFEALLFLPFHYLLQSELGRFLVFAIYIAPPLWCQLDTLLQDSLPLGEHAAGQALKLMSAGCQFYDQFHFEAHLIYGPGSSL